MYIMMIKHDHGQGLSMIKEKTMIKDVNEICSANYRSHNREDNLLAYIEH